MIDIYNRFKLVELAGTPPKADSSIDPSAAFLLTCRSYGRVPRIFAMLNSVIIATVSSDAFAAFQKN